MCATCVGVSYGELVTKDTSVQVNDCSNLSGDGKLMALVSRSFFLIRETRRDVMPGNQLSFS